MSQSDVETMLKIVPMLFYPKLQRIQAQFKVSLLCFHLLVHYTQKVFPNPGVYPLTSPHSDVAKRVMVPTMNDYSVRLMAIIFLVNRKQRPVIMP